MREKLRLKTFLEYIVGFLISVLLIAPPWLFGTTEDWSVRLMNVAAISLGIFWLCCLVFLQNGRSKAYRGDGIFVWLMLVVNLSVICFTLVAWLNARATFSVEARSFEYRDSYIPWLPTTYDSLLTREALVTYVALFSFFWVMKGWVERGADSFKRSTLKNSFSNRRFLFLAWVVAINGFAISIQGLLQRLSGSSKLLWMRDSWWKSAETCFGPYSYRGNAAQYINLIWPLAIGLWWILSKERRATDGSRRVISDGPELLLIPITIVMVCAALSTLSRGGAIIAILILIGLALAMTFQKTATSRGRIAVATGVIVVFSAAWWIAGAEVLQRFKSFDKQLGGRAEIYENAKQIAADFPYFGSGPGTFRSVYHLYRGNPGEMWHGFLHNDWLEARVTFGWVGFSLIILNLVVLACWIFQRSRQTKWKGLSVCCSAGILGVLVHAIFDFPFQTYSILFTFVAIAALLTSVPERRSRISGKSNDFHQSES